VEKALELNAVHDREHRKVRLALNVDDIFQRDLLLARPCQLSIPGHAREQSHASSCTRQYVEMIVIDKVHEKSMTNPPATKRTLSQSRRNGIQAKQRQTDKAYANNLHKSVEGQQHDQNSNS